MGAGALLVFIYAARRDYFHNIEDVKYQVFWSDLEELVNSPTEEQTNEGREGNRK